MDVGKKNAWRDARVAGEYEARRFGRPGQKVKHRWDAALLRAVLGGADGVRSVLDMPTGTGRLLSSFRGAGYFTVGSDISAEMLGMALVTQTAGEALPHCVQAEGEHLPFPDSSFDAVVSMRFLFHVRDAETRAAILREMARVARVVVVGQVRYRATAKHALRWARSRVGLSRRYRPSRSRRDIANELADAGLELLRLVPVSRLFSDKALFVARPRP